jgi:hypothetical protein
MITCPKNEQMWWLYKSKSGKPIFLLTSKKNNRDYYYLYEVIPGDELKKLGRAKTPPELEEKFDVDRKMLEL